MSKRSRSVDVAVVGGGVIGLAIAWRAAQRGLSVTVLERGRPGEGTSHVAAGMLAPVSEASLSEQAVLRLGLESVALYPAFVAELLDASGDDPGYLACGTLVVARDRDEAESLDRELALREQLGLRVERLLPSETRRREPAVAPTVRLGLEVPDDHAIDPRKLVAAIEAAVLGAGGEILAGTEVVALTSSGERVTGVRTADGSELAAGDVVVAAGVWSPMIAGVPSEAIVPVRPVKGQVMRLHDPAGPGLLSRVLRMQTGYLVPRGDGRYVLGATMEEQGHDVTVTGGAVHELLRDAIELVPGVSELVIDELSAGLRPGTPDNAPALGPGAMDHLHWATGHYRNGILLTPVTAKIVVEALIGSVPVPPEFDPGRFTAAVRV